jgi:hypothetical protein
MRAGDGGLHEGREGWRVHLCREGWGVNEGRDNWGSAGRQRGLWKCVIAV